MQVVINHVTRMDAPRICVAGIEPNGLRHIRPVTPPTDLITRRLLRENGGPFGPGALVDIGSATPHPTPPETEDHLFDISHVKHVEDLDGRSYYELLGRIGSPDISSAFGDALVEVRSRKFAVPAGTGTCSLAVVPVIDANLAVAFEKLYLTIGPSPHRARLRVTDARFYEDDHKTLRPSVIKNVKNRLARGVAAYAMLGLARPMLDDDGGYVHWLMANGLCLADRPVGDVP